jgi:hypothetical protein
MQVYDTALEHRCKEQTARKSPFFAVFNNWNAKTGRKTAFPELLRLKLRPERAFPQRS